MAIPIFARSLLCGGTFSPAKAHFGRAFFLFSGSCFGGSIQPSLK
jgi:hypothetical protein